VRNSSGGVIAAVLLLALMAGGGTPVPAAEIDVVASIKPVHSLVAGVMQDAGEPVLLVKGTGSEHSYSLRPSEARALEQAEVVFWVGETMETFLIKPLRALREILRRIARSEGLNVVGLSDHELHSLGVRLAERHDGPGKLLHKTLDRRHAAAIKAFAAARDEGALEAQWQAALASGAIPGGYWALLTHPYCSKRLVIRAFGEVHMLSHLVGASNRADIACLRAIEEDNAQLQAELSTQRRGWRHALAERDTRVRRLEEQLHALAAAPAAPEPRPTPTALEASVRDRLAALEARLARESERRTVAEERYREGEAKRAAEAEQREAVEAENASLRAEADALQEQLRSLLGEPHRADEAAPTLNLGGARVLVVGARPAQIAHWRALVERCAGELLHHDGGVDDNILGLRGLVSRADLILFPADCVSHEAMWSVKRLAAQLGKPYRPMRTASLAAFTHALREIAAAAVRG
jgi:Uncharacterized protein conserved in bacteria (DUF2325)/Zinc-uptake complex component A periplasmic